MIAVIRDASGRITQVFDAAIDDRPFHRYYSQREKSFTETTGHGSGIVQFKVDDSAFSAALQRVYNEGQKSAAEVVLYGIIKLCQSARQMTPRGRARRKIETVGAAVSYSGGVFADEDTLGDDSYNEGRQSFEVWKQGLDTPKRVYLPIVPKGKKNANLPATIEAARRRADLVKRLAPIDRVGLAKKSWGWAMAAATQALGFPSTVPKMPGTGYRGPIIVGNKIAGGVQVVNKLGWITALVPGIEVAMQAKATAGLQWQIENKWIGGLRKAGAA